MNAPIGFGGAAPAALAGTDQSGSGDTGEPLPVARLSYASQGREWHMIFANGATRFDLRYEFGGGDCLAYINVRIEKE